MIEPENRKQNGFTLIELLVVISIISLLSSAVLSSLSGARQQAKVTAARSELNNIRRAVERLMTDTGTLPGGCPVEPRGSNILLFLYEKQAGLTQKPFVGQVSGYYPGTPCQWTANEVNEWDGPYIKKDQLYDPWGHPYTIDTTYWIYPPPPDSSSCPKEVMNSKYTGRGPKIFSQAEWTVARTQGEIENDNPSSYEPQCDDVWVPLIPQYKGFM